LLERLVSKWTSIINQIPAFPPERRICGLEPQHRVRLFAVCMLTLGDHQVCIFHNQR
jgi:hypothetical protein